MAQEIADSTLLDTWASGGNIVEPDISKIIEGWQLGEQPPHEYMNWLQNTFGSKLNHILKNGVTSWNNETEYLAGSSVQHNGNVWLCKTTNTNSEPTDVNANWKRIITVESLTTVLGGYVATTGDQDIDDIKTFLKSPVVPTPTTGTQAVNKDYVDSKPTLPIGTILNGYTIFDNCIVAFGGEFNRADYPKLWTYLQANPSLVKTQTQWTSEATTNSGICGFFSDGNGTTTFRVPNLDKAFLRPDSRVVGSFQSDAIRDITGLINSMVSLGGTTTTGVFTGSNLNGQANWKGSSVGNSGVIDFKASNSVPTAAENRPKNIAVLPLIVAK